MKASADQALPLAPLLSAYGAAGLPSLSELEGLPGLGPRIRAVRGARDGLLREAFLDTASEAAFREALVEFYQACAAPAPHAETVRRRAGFVRHALAYVLRGRDPLARKVDQCLAADGAYRVAGLGRSFWSALFQALDPQTRPGWTAATEAGLRRLGLARRGAGGVGPWSGAAPGRAYAAVQAAYGAVRAQGPALTALHVDHFLSLVAGMCGRDLFAGMLPDAGQALKIAVARERARIPLRQRLKEDGPGLEHARRELESGLAARDGARILAALASTLGPVAWSPDGETLTLWVGRLWEADDPYEMLERFWQANPFPGSDLLLPTAVLHLRDPGHFLPWDEGSRSAYRLLSDTADSGEPLAERYRLFNEAGGWLRGRHGVQPLEAPAVLAGFARLEERTVPEPAGFRGFAADTFRFLAELAENNGRTWMAANRQRYRFAVREPLAELCRELALRYVSPVLCAEHGWDLETTARSGRCLTSVCKNDFGRTVPYHTDLWITFYRRGCGGKGDDAQLFVRLAAGGLSYGFRLGGSAREAGRLFRRNVAAYADLLYQALADHGALAECRFGDAEELFEPRIPAGPDDLRHWAKGKTLVAAKSVPAGDRLLCSDDLVGDVLLTFDRLLPAYVCAAEAEPFRHLARRAGAVLPRAGYAEADFRRGTSLPDEWLARARSLLDIKKQLILQGVPGTGKTHVARCLARLLTRGRDEAVRLVQFHPAYSYEEFVEGIKVRSVDVGGRHEVTYPVEDGLLGAFAAEAARRPTEPHVLVIDEINRGNLPRIFGELLYLLEYREQVVCLPYSRRNFRLPGNLYLIGTMNAADRSVALVDQALRRRFSFLEMHPDGAVLAQWLRSHPPADGPAFADRVVALFEGLNARLRSEVGPSCQVGHSYFMVPGLDEGRLGVVWDHQVRPLVEEYFSGRPIPFRLEDMLADGGRARGRKRATAGVIVEA